QRNMNLGKAAPEFRDEPRQKIACLRVRTCNDQTAFIATCKFIADLFQIIDLDHDALDNASDRLPRLGTPFEALAVAFEHLDAQLIFKFDDRLGYAGLRGEQNSGGLGQVVVTSDGFTYKTKLL